VYSSVVKVRILTQISGKVNQFETLILELGKRVEFFMDSLQKQNELFNVLNMHVDGAFNEWDTQMEEMSLLSTHKISFEQVHTTINVKNSF
jgi:hypothetical protein